MSDKIPQLNAIKNSKDLVKLAAWQDLIEDEIDEFSMRVRELVQKRRATSFQLDTLGEGVQLGQWYVDVADDEEYAFVTKVGRKYIHYMCYCLTRHELDEESVLINMSDCKDLISGATVGRKEVYSNWNRDVSQRDIGSFVQERRLAPNMTVLVTTNWIEAKQILDKRQHLNSQLSICKVSGTWYTVHSLYQH